MAKKAVSPMMSGAGWIGDFTSQLIRGLRAAGKTDEEIHALVTEDGAENMQRVVAGVVASMVPKHPAAELIEQYFHQVYGHTLDLAGMAFPEREGFPAWMASPPELDEDKIWECGTKHFKVNAYAHKTPIAANINRVVAQKRPSGLYVFAHRGGDEPDAMHRKSYDQGMTEDLTFANSKEYLLMTFFHRFVKSYFMDKKGWTRTSSLWSDGCVVDGRWDGVHTRLYLDDGYRGYAHSDGGLRELFLG